MGMSFSPASIILKGDGIIFDPARIPASPAVSRFLATLAAQKGVQEELGATNRLEASAALRWQSTYETDLTGRQIVTTPLFCRGERALLNLAAKTRSELPGWARIQVLDSGDFVVTNAFPPDAKKTLVCTSVMGQEHAAELLDVVRDFVAGRHAWVSSVVKAYPDTSSSEVKDRAFAAFNRGAWGASDARLTDVSKLFPVPPAMGGGLMRLKGFNFKEYLSADTYAHLHNAANAGPAPHWDLGRACLEIDWHAFSHPVLVGTFPAFEDSVRASIGDPSAQLVHIHVHPFTPMTPSLAALIDKRGSGFDGPLVRQCLAEVDTPEILNRDAADLRLNHRVTVARIAAAEDVLATLEDGRRPTLTQMQPLMVGIQDEAVGQLNFFATCTIDDWTPLPREYRGRYSSPEAALAGETLELVNQILTFDRANIGRIEQNLAVVERLRDPDFRAGLNPDEVLIHYSTIGRIGTFTESPLDADSTFPYRFQDSAGNLLPTAVGIISNPFGRVVAISHSEHPEGEVFIQTRTHRHRVQFDDYRTGHRVGGFELNCRFDHYQPSFNPPGRLSETGVFPACVARSIDGTGHVVLLPENSLDTQARIGFQALVAGASPYEVTVQSLKGERVYVFPLSGIDVAAPRDSLVPALANLGFATDPIRPYLHKIEFWARVWLPGSDPAENLDRVVRGGF